MITNEAINMSVSGSIAAVQARARNARRYASDPAVSNILPHRHSDGSVRKYPEGTTEKPCSKCLIVKTLDAYMPQKKGALGRYPVCNECRRAASKEYTRKHREDKAGRPRPDRCDCCGEPHTARRAMHWDHDHSTNRFRGWLCHWCNTALGNVKDSIVQLNQLVAYIQRGGGPG
jgi:hypothetical protein